MNNHKQINNDNIKKPYVVEYYKEMKCMGNYKPPYRFSDNSLSQFIFKTNFEVIDSSNIIKEKNFILDYDNKHNIKSLISFNQIIEETENIKGFFKNVYSIDKVNCFIKISINKEQENEKYDLNEKWVNSFHIITNVSFNSIEEGRNLTNQYFEHSTLQNYIDTGLYIKKRILRGLYQCKGGDRKDFFYPYTHDKNNCFTIPFEQLNMNDYFITDCSNSTKINVQYDFKKKQIEHKKSNNINIKYIVNIFKNKNQFNQLKELIQSFKPAENSKIWRFRLIQTVAIINNLSITQQEEEEIKTLFYNIERLPAYNTPLHLDNDKKQIEQYFNNKQKFKNNNYNFFKNLSTEEEHFIYDKLNLDYSTLTQWKLKKINTNYNNFLELVHNDIKAIYDIDKKILVKNPVVSRNEQFNFEKNEYKQKQIINKQNVECEYNFNLYQIEKEAIEEEETENLKLQQIKNIKLNNINSWEEVQANNNNEFNNGAVGSRKTSLRLNKDLEFIKKGQDNFIICINDTISMTQKTKREMLEFFNEEEIFYYQDKKGFNPDKHKILIVCINSIHKFQPLFNNISHVIIDEVKNVINAQIEDNKKECLDFLSDLFKYKIIKLYDADKDILTIKTLKELNLLNRELTINNLQNYEQYNNIIEIQDYNNVMLEIVQNLKMKRKISISISSTEKGKKIIDYINSKLENINYVFSNSTQPLNSKAENKIATPEFLKNLYANANNEWGEFDLFIYTSKICTGLSYDIENTFYKHYAFIMANTENATQSSQMIFRVRRLITKTLCIIPIKNHFNLLNPYKTNFNFQNMEQNNIKFIEHINKSTGLSIEFIKSKYETINLNQCIKILENSTYSISQKIDNITLLKKVMGFCKIRDIIKTCLKWGCTTLKSNIYNLNEEKPKNKEIEYKPIREYEKEEWLKIKLIEDIENYDKECNEEEIKMKNKFYQLLNLGYETEFMNLLNENEHSKIYGRLTEPARLKNYKKIKNLMLYQHKDFIYYLFDNLFKNNNIEVIDKEEKNLLERARMTKDILFMYQGFKILDISNIQMNDINAHIENDELHKPKFNIEKNEDNLKKLMDLYNETEYYLKFIQANINDNTELKMKTNLTKATDYKKICCMVEHSLNHLGLEFEAGRESARVKKDKVFTIYHNVAFSCRLNNEDITDLRPMIKQANFNKLKNHLFKYEKYISNNILEEYEDNLNNVKQNKQSEPTEFLNFDFPDIQAFETIEDNEDYEEEEDLIEEEQTDQYITSENL